MAERRMQREYRDLKQPNKDYFIIIDKENLFKFDAFIYGPPGSVYSYRVVKLNFQIPPDFPNSPPKCKLIQHSKGRMHPNLYEDGTVCLSILNTWPEGPSWDSKMTLSAVLVSIRSILDNDPSKHEPIDYGDFSDFNNYVEFASWKIFLLDYIYRETDDIKEILEEHVRSNLAQIVEMLEQLEKKVPRAWYWNPYNCHEIMIDYALLRKDFLRRFPAPKSTGLWAPRLLRSLKGWVPYFPSNRP